MFAARLNAVALTALIAAAAAAPAQAQLVPRLVDIPNVRTTACVADTAGAYAHQTTVTYEQGRAHQTLAIYAGRACSKDALLITFDGRSATPTPLGASLLAQRCAQIPWKAGTPQDVSSMTGFGDACLGENLQP